MSNNLIYYVIGLSTEIRHIENLIEFPRMSIKINTNEWIN